MTSVVIVVAMIATHGVAAVAGYGVAMRIEPMFLIPFYALSAVTSPFFGQNFGAGQFDRLLEARRVITRFSLLFGLAGLGAVVVFEFVTKDDPMVHKLLLNKDDIYDSIKTFFSKGQ